MKNIINKIFKSSILGAIALVVLGVLLIFESEATIVTISYVIGGVLVAIGVLALLKFYKEVKDNQDTGMDLVYGIISVVLGIIVISNPKAVASIIPIVMGLIIIINSGTKLQYSIELKKNNNNLWKSTMVLSLISTLCGVLLIFNPFKGAAFLTRLIGFLILLYAVLDIISTITIKSTVKKIKSAINDGIEEAKIVEVKEKSLENKKETNKKKEIKDDDK
ncbi:MAG: DUF308 domain-containing protein [Bacilli bacterium]|nr:DUF308 domain-containing protein [Bacilli bacterium]MBQ8534739.1 DUF308 domain-containing protein [Bacilli bacterium]